MGKPLHLLQPNPLTRFSSVDEGTAKNHFVRVKGNGIDIRTLIGILHGEMMKQEHVFLVSP